jgi:dihydropteroate synthase
MRTFTDMAGDDTGIGRFAPMPGPTLRIGDRTNTIDGTLVMGVVNASPDSFSDGGEHTTLDERLALADRLVAEGADVVDVGGQSGITGVPEVEPGEEAARVVPVIAGIRERHPDVLISVDTYKPAVVEAAIEAGASIVNDVSGLRYPDVASICAGTGAALVLMHTAAPPKVRLADPHRYGDVVGEVHDFLAAKLDEAVALGVPEEALIVDPGPDFTKTPAQTIDIVRNLDRFRAFGRPLLLALSRKDFIGAILRKPPRQRLAGTIAAIAHVAAVGGNIVRVHDVAAARDVLAVVEVLAGRADVAADYELPMSLRREPLPAGPGDVS